MKVAVYSAIRRCLRMATMVLPPRVRPSYWPRMFPRTLVKTCVLALGVLLWLLYFYSTSNYAYDRRPTGGGGGDSKRAEGFILRRPTVPLFEGPIEGDSSTITDDPSIIAPKAATAPTSGSEQKAAQSVGSPSKATPPTEVLRGSYAILENLLESRLNFGYNKSVTITTHATYELLDNLIYLSKRWQGPISVAVYAPHDDFKTALLYALWLRRCHPTIRDYVTFHFVYPATQGMAPFSGMNGQKVPEQRLNPMLEKSPKTQLNLSEALKPFQNQLRTSKVSVDSIGEPGTFENSPKTLRNGLDGSSKALNDPTGSSKVFQIQLNVLQNSPESSKVVQNPPESSKELPESPEPSRAFQNPFEPSKTFQNSQKTLKSSQISLKAPKNSPAEPSKVNENPSWAFHNSPEGPAPFQEPVLGYEHLARDIISRYGISPKATSPTCESTSFPLPRSYRHRHGLPYPINVCRNVARLNAKTHFVLASDIELYPSADVVAAFLEFSQREVTPRLPASSSLTSFFLRGPAAASTLPTPRVYVLPIFEVDRSVATVPATKAALVDLYRRKKAVYFHKHVCSFCNIIPRLNRWLVAPTPPKGRRHLGVFMSIKRHKPFNRWEPIYIGTNSEPLYDERLTWEGQQDKMTQMYELCLMNYDLAILDNAFLVHRPGIKTKNATEYKLKSQFIAQNNKIYKSIIADLEKKHGTNAWCK